MTEVAKMLQQEIQAAGVISFARFMELALYCPKIGYYEQPDRVIGRAGDFYTSVSTGQLFGELLAYQFAEWLQGLAGHIQCVEAGAHDGQLALDILNWLSLQRADLLERLEYWIVEPSPTRQEWQRHKLDKFAGRVRWSDSLPLPVRRGEGLGEGTSCAQVDSSSLSPSDGERAGVRGIIFSNELLDAFPVHRLGWNAADRTWFEWGVGMKNGQFVWAKMAGTGDSLVPENRREGTGCPPFWPAELLAALPDGFTIEFCPAATAWWHQAASVLRAGQLLTIDYGLTEDEILAPQRAGGTLRSYYRHHLASDPLANPGEQDLTAHVNFSLLQRTGEAAGLRTEGLFSQAHFLVGIAEKLWTKESPLADWPPARIRQFQTLTHPELLGRSFRVLIQSR